MQLIWKNQTNLKIRDFFKSIGITSLDIYFDPDFKLVKTFKMRGLTYKYLIR